VIVVPVIVVPEIAPAELTDPADTAPGVNTDDPRTFADDEI
jgi:hypothetical protein